MGPEYTVALPDKSRYANRRRLLPDGKMTGAFHNALRDHIANFFLYNPDQYHPLQSRQQRFRIVLVYRDGFMVPFCIGENPNRRCITVSVGADAN